MPLGPSTRFGFESSKVDKTYWDSFQGMISPKADQQKDKVGNPKDGGEDNSPSGLTPDNITKVVDFIANASPRKTEHIGRTIKAMRTIQEVEGLLRHTPLSVIYKLLLMGKDSKFLLNAFIFLGSAKDGKGISMLLSLLLDKNTQGDVLNTLNGLDPKSLEKIFAAKVPFGGASTPILLLLLGNKATQKSILLMLQRLSPEFLGDILTAKIPVNGQSTPLISAKDGTGTSIMLSLLRNRSTQKDVLAVFDRLSPDTRKKIFETKIFLNGRAAPLTAFLQTSNALRFSWGMFFGSTEKNVGTGRENHGGKGSTLNSATRAPSNGGGSMPSALANGTKLTGKQLSDRQLTSETSNTASADGFVQEDSPPPLDDFLFSLSPTESENAIRDARPIVNSAKIGQPTNKGGAPIVNNQQEAEPLDPLKEPSTNIKSNNTPICVQQ
jgi:hypothetical protein